MSVPSHESPDLAEATRYQRDVYLVWRTAHELGGLALTRRHALSRPHVRALLQALGENVDDDKEPERLRFVRQFAQRIGLLSWRQEPSLLQAAPRELMTSYVETSFAERLRLGARLWMTGGWWQEETTTPGTMAPLPPRVALARRGLLDDLAALPHGGSMRVPAPLLRHQAVINGLLAEELAGGLDVHAVRAALLGPLTWLGFVVPEGAHIAVPHAAPTACLTTMALSALRDDAGISEHGGRIVIQSDMTIIAYPPFTAPALLQLDACTERRSQSTTAHYVLTRSALAKALARGIELDAFVHGLERLSAIPLPASVRTRLEDWARHTSRMRLLSPVDVLIVERPTILDALLADRVAARWVIRRLGPTAALIAAGCAGQVHAWLVRRGEAPAWERSSL